jgi:chromosome segregation ATPase
MTDKPETAEVSGVRGWLLAPHAPALAALADRIAALDARMIAADRHRAEADDRRAETDAAVATLRDRIAALATRIATIEDRIDPALRSAEAWSMLHDAVAEDRARLEALRIDLTRLDKQCALDAQASRMAEQGLFQRIEQVRGDAGITPAPETPPARGG